MLEAILIPRIRKCTPKSFPTPISQRAKTYWPFILNNVLLLFITRKNISCETMRHVMVYNVWYDYSLSPNILPRQVLLYLIYHERVHCTVIVCPVWRLWVLRALEARGRGWGRERETSSWAQNVLSWAVLCTAHYTVQYTAGYRAWGVSDRELARPETRGCHLSCLQTISVAPRSPPTSKSVTQCVTSCDRLWQCLTCATQNTRNTLAQSEIYPSTFYKTIMSLKVF